MGRVAFCGKALTYVGRPDVVKDTENLQLQPKPFFALFAPVSNDVVNIYLSESLFVFELFFSTKASANTVKQKTHYLEVVNADGTQSVCLWSNMLWINRNGDEGYISFDDDEFRTEFKKMLGRGVFHYECTTASDGAADDKKDATCAICLDSYSANSNYQSLKCKHRFHSVCILQWLRTNRTCPLCRRDYA